MAAKTKKLRTSTARTVVEHMQELLLQQRRVSDGIENETMENPRANAISNSNRTFVQIVKTILHAQKVANPDLGRLLNAPATK